MVIGIIEDDNLLRKALDTSYEKSRLYNDSCLLQEKKQLKI